MSPERSEEEAQREKERFGSAVVSWMGHPWLGPWVSLVRLDWRELKKIPTRLIGP